MVRILVIDDDQDIQRLMSFTLNRAGFAVELADDGLDGLEKLAAFHPHLIIADLMMPKMTGFDFCQQVRGIAAYEDVPILIYSARFQEVDRQAAMAAGASDYMPKSVTPDQILAKIKALLQEAGIDPGATKGKMVGLLSLRGGVGVTSLSVNLAVALALSRRIAVGLLDLAPLAGHAALLLGLRPTKSYLDVFATDVVTMDHIRPCLISHDSGVQLLASPLSQPGTAVDGEHFSDLGHRLSIAFPYTVVDLAHSLSAASNALLPNISNVILVIGPDIGSIQSAAVAQQRLATLGLDQQRISLVLNHTSPASGLGRAAIEKALHREVAHEIPYAAEMLSALNNRTPLMLHAPQSGVAKAIARLVASLTG